MTKLDSILERRDITLRTKVHLVKAMVFPVVLYGCESWDYKESWALKNWCFELWVGEDSWESLGLQGDKSILKEISPECSLDRLVLKLKLQYFGHLMWRTDSLEKTLILGRTEGRRRRGRRRMRSWMAPLIQWRWVWAGYRSCWWTGKPGVLQFMGSQRGGHDWATKLKDTDDSLMHIPEVLCRYCNCHEREISNCMMTRLQPWQSAASFFSQV